MDRSKELDELNTQISLRSLLSLAFIEIGDGLAYVHVYERDSSSIATLCCREIILNDVLDFITDRKHSGTQPIHSLSDFALD